MKIGNLLGYLTNFEGRGIVGLAQRAFWPDTESLWWHPENVLRTRQLYPAFRPRLPARKKAPGEEATRGTGTLASSRMSRKLSIR